MKNNNKFRMNVWILFCTMFIASYVRFWNTTILKFVALGMIQILALVDIVKNDIKIKLDKKTLIIVFLILFNMFLSNINSKNILESFLKIISIIDLFILTIILLPTYFRNIDIKELLCGILKAFTVVLCICIIMYSSDYIYTYNSGRIGSDTRLYAGFSHPNTLGLFAFVNFCSAILLYFYYNEHDFSKSKKLIVFSILISVYVFYKSDCRTAQISAVLLSGIIFFDKVLRKNINLKLCVILIGIAGLIFFVLNNVEMFTYEMIDKISSYRLSYIQDAIENLIEGNDLLFGQGAYRNSSLNLDGAILLDNGYMNVLYQYGLLTFIAFCCFIIRQYFMLLEGNSENNGILSVFVVFLAYALMDNILLNISSFFSIYMYMLIALQNIKRKSEKSEIINNSISNI